MTAAKRTADLDLHNRVNAAIMTQFPAYGVFRGWSVLGMSIRIPVTLGTNLGLKKFVLGIALLLCFAATMQAQCPAIDPDAPPKPPSPNATSEELLP